VVGVALICAVVRVVLMWAGDEKTHASFGDFEVVKIEAMGNEAYEVDALSEQHVTAAFRFRFEEFIFNIATFYFSCLKMNSLQNRK
jgi:hypothetical protein